MPNRITPERIQMYLALEGHLPERILLTEIFNLSESQADKVVRELRRLQIENNPSVMSLHLAGRRKQLRDKYQIAQVENEEMIMHQGVTMAHQIQQSQQPQGFPGIRLSGNIGDLIRNVLGGTPATDPMDKPSSLSIEDFLNKNFKPQPKEDEDGDEE